MSLLELGGRSVAGLETCIEVPSLKLLLDLGVCSRTAVNQRWVLLSHGHLDHMGAIAMHAARRSLLGMQEGVYFVPEAVASQVEAFFNAAGALDGQVIPRRVVPLSPEREESLGKQRTLRPFRTFHRVPSQGYTVWEKRSRLLPEFRGLPGERLGELRRGGVEINESYEVPLLSFTGDTRIEALESSPELSHTECLVVECSFLDERVPVAQAREMGHIHLDELVARRELLPKTDVVLSHFSSRYTADEIGQLLKRKLPDDVAEVARILPSL
jgi:ribonuclease Z